MNTNLIQKTIDDLQLAISELDVNIKDMQSRRLKIADRIAEWRHHLKQLKIKEPRKRAKKGDNAARIKEYLESNNISSGISIPKISKDLNISKDSCRTALLNNPKDFEKFEENWRIIAYKG